MCRASALNNEWFVVYILRYNCSWFDKSHSILDSMKYQMIQLDERKNEMQTEKQRDSETAGNSWRTIRQRDTSALIVCLLVARLHNANYVYIYFFFCGDSIKIACTRCDGRVLKFCINLCPPNTSLKATPICFLCHLCLLLHCFSVLISTIYQSMPSMHFLHLFLYVFLLLLLL